MIYSDAYKTKINIKINFKYQKRLKIMSIMRVNVAVQISFNETVLLNNALLVLCLLFRQNKNLIPYNRIFINTQIYKKTFTFLSITGFGLFLAYSRFVLI